MLFLSMVNLHLFSGEPASLSLLLSSLPLSELLQRSTRVWKPSPSYFQYTKNYILAKRKIGEYLFIYSFTIRMSTNFLSWWCRFVSLFLMFLFGIVRITMISSGPNSFLNETFCNKRGEREVVQSVSLT